MDIKKLVEHICCDYTQGTLIDMCDFYYRGMRKESRKAKRHDLEQLAFIILSLNIDPAGIYEIHTDDKEIFDCVSAVKAVDFIFKKTLYFWADEPEYPVTKDALHERVYIKRIGIREI